MLVFFPYNNILNFAAALDIILSWKAWGSMEYTQIIRYLLKFAAATAWIIILPIGYSSSVQNPTGLIKFFSNWVGNWRNQSLFSFAVVIYMLPNILSALLFVLPPLRRAMERSNSHIVILLMWWAQARILSFWLCTFASIIDYLYIILHLSLDYMWEEVCMRICSRFSSKII